MARQQYPFRQEVSLRSRQIEAQREAARGERISKAQRLAWEKEQWGKKQEQLRTEWGLSREAMGQMVREYNRAYGEAATGEEKRYQEMRGIAEATTGQRAADIRSDYTEQQSTAMQRLQRLGMANTTVAPTMAMGYQREQQSALNRLSDQMQQTKLGIIERRDPRYPQQGMITSMAQLMGRGGTATRAAAPLAGMRQF